MSALFESTFTCLCLAALTLSASDPLVLSFDPERVNQLRVRDVGDGAMEFVTLGEDPFAELRPFPHAAASAARTILAFEYFAPDGVDGLSVYYGPPFSESKQIAAGSLGRSESWMPHAIDMQSLSAGAWTPESNRLRIDIGRKAGVTLQIRNLHLREPSAEERRSQAGRQSERREKLVREARINAFYSADFPDRVDEAAVNRTQVVIRGRTGASSNRARLIELRPEISLADRARLEDGDFILESQPGVLDAGPLGNEGDFERILPRKQSGRDRTTSRWALAEPLPGGEWKLRSHWKYATDLADAAEYDPPRLNPKGIKGMGGVSSVFPLEELLELGVHHITINIDVARLLDAAPHEGWESFEHGGREWHVRPHSLAEYDKLATFSARNGVVASGILLVSFANSEFAETLIHPEANRAGHYAMPDFTTAEGVAAYEAALDFLARRYNEPGAPHGRIANWIMHNEVGFGWEWTNMGRQPPMLYMDHYLRSMRLTHNVARRYDPHARVFISLTHHWNTPDDPSWKSYSNIDFLNRLAESSRVEGGFAWGVAFHPYPQNLRRPEAWNDDRAFDGFETPFITPKNIAVLDRWMRRPEMRDANGEVRGVLLSEQGFNTPDYTMESQRLQAAGFVYMWRQMRGLKSIEAFHNHRWVDHPNEGGLLLGIRKLPADGKPYGEKKLAWDVYKALDTEEEQEAVAFADNVIRESSR